MGRAGLPYILLASLAACGSVNTPQTISVTVTGVSGSGLVLQNNGGDDLSISADGTFTFATQAFAGGPYAITVRAQPKLPTQGCAVENGSGTVGSGPVTISVACTTSAFTVGGMITGLVPTKNILLKNNGGDDLMVDADGMFTFATPIESGQPFAVTIGTQPLSEVCTVDAASATGMVIDANLTTVRISCARGVNAWGEFHRSLKCGDFVRNGANTQQWCFTLKGLTRCMGAWADMGSCTDTAAGIQILTAPASSWPLRFNPNADACLNYNPDPAYVQNLANALGYSSYTINVTQTGNGCDLSWIDNNGDYATAAGTGNSALAEIYDIIFF